MATMKTAIVIPSRLTSTRLPEKPLAKLHGKELIRWVWDGVRTAHVDGIFMAVDSERLADFCEEHGIPCIVTDPSLPSGTDRVHAAITGRGYDFVVNVQGDEPLMKGSAIDSFLGFIKSFPEATKESAVFTMAKRVDSAVLYADMNCVKAVVGAGGKALYFSRASVPFDRNGKRTDFLRHYGIYAYSVRTLERFVSLGKSELEEREKLEQLRWLDYGGDIFVQEVAFDLMAIDTPTDVANFERCITLNGNPVI